MKVSHLAASAAAVAVVGVIGSAASAAIVSVNITDVAATGAGITGSETFGIASLNTVVGNWNNKSGMGTGSPSNNLIDDNGNVTGVSAVALNGGGNQYWGATYQNTAWNYGVAQFPATAGSVSLTLSNLNAQFPQGYYAIVYVNGPTANTGSAITDGTTTYFYRPSNPASVTPILITDTNSGDGYDVGNYALFGSQSSPLTANSITFSVPVGATLSQNAGIGGVQLVAIPEPASLALLGLGGLMLRRRGG